MLDQAYDQGCGAALQELAEAFGEDVVGELVKIAQKKEMSKGEMAGAGLGGAVGAAGAGYGGYRGGEALAKRLGEGGTWHEKHLKGLEEKLLKKGKKTPEELAKAIASRKTLLGRASKAGGKWPMGVVAGLAGAGGLGYLGKKVAE